jgi:hypothetical protein
VRSGRLEGLHGDLAGGREDNARIHLADPHELRDGILLAIDGCSPQLRRELEAEVASDHREDFGAVRLSELKRRVSTPPIPNMATFLLGSIPALLTAPYAITPGRKRGAAATASRFDGIG